MNIDTTHMINIEDIPNHNLDNIDELIALSREALIFINSQQWCKRIIHGKLERGWGYVIAVFFFIIEPAYDNIPNHIWVIVGDLPPAYIDVETNSNGVYAIDSYVMEMQKWIDSVMNSKSVEELIPVNVPPTKEYARMLQERLDIIREELLANLRDEMK